MCAGCVGACAPAHTYAPTLTHSHVCCSAGHATRTAAVQALFRIYALPHACCPLQSSYISRVAASRVHSLHTRPHPHVSAHSDQALLWACSEYVVVIERFCQSRNDYHHGQVLHALVGCLKSTLQTWRKVIADLEGGKPVQIHTMQVQTAACNPAICTAFVPSCQSEVASLLGRQVTPHCGMHVYAMLPA